MEKYRKAYPIQLSGGMQQRGSIIRAFITNPKIITYNTFFGNKCTDEILKIYNKFETIIGERGPGV